MRSLERRIRKIENQTTKKTAFDKIIIIHEPSDSCDALDSRECPDYVKVLQSPEPWAICAPSCGDCAEGRVER